MSDIVERYRMLARSADPGERQLARRQLERLQRAATRITAHGSRWKHVPLAELFAEAGNILYERPNGTMTCGHEPVHGSKSRQCVVLWPAEGRWWCASCRCGGDALAFVMALRGCAAREAALELAARFGPPAITPHRRRARVLEA